MLNSKGNDKYKLDIDPKEAEIVRTMFKLYFQGSREKSCFGSLQLATYLNEKGLRNRNGKKWQKQYILKILSNPVYIGRYYFNKSDPKNKATKPDNEWIMIQVPAILGNEFFEKVQEIIKKRDPKVTNPKATTSPSLLFGLLKCGKCNSSMIRETGKGTKYSYYNCRKTLKEGKSSCPGQRIPREELEKQLLSHVANKMFNTESTKRFLK